MTSSVSASSVVNGRYRLQQWIRRTTLSDDYEAHDLLLDRTVVFKALLPELAGDRSFIERFRAQAQATANLSHPALASVFDWGRDPNGIEGRSGPTYYLVGEQVTGRTLSDYVRANGPMPIDRALHVLVGVTSALGYAHRSGVLHGGITPDVITVSPTGVVKVFDLGLNVALGSNWQPPMDHPEVAAWRAPEQFRGEPPEPRTDVYQLGLVAYYLVTGRVPFAGETVEAVAQRHLQSVPPAPSKLNPAIPKAFESIIGRSMAKVIDERFASVNDQRAAIVRFRESRAAGSGNGPTPAAAATGPTRGSAAAPIAAEALVGGTSSGPATGSRSTSPADDRTVATSRAATTTTAAEPPRRGRRATRDAAREDATRVMPAGAPDVLAGPERDFDGLDDKPRGGRRTAIYAIVLLLLLAVLGGLVFLLYKQLGLGSQAKADIAVPSVIGRPSAEAESAISAAGLIVDTITEPNSSVAADTVFDQSPSAGSKVASDSKVIIKVSSGIAVPTVPNVVGDTIDTARSKLAAAGFPVAIKEKQDDSQPAGTVISQDPAAEATTPEGTTVTIVVATSTGTVEIANVAGKSPDDARLALTKAGFRIAVQTEASPTVEKGVVTRTDPAAGTKVDHGASVIIYVSGGNAVAVPSVLGQDQATAVATLSGLGLKVDVTARAVVDQTDAGKVVSQTPVGGKDAAPGDTVVIRVGQFDASAATSSTKKPASTTTQASNGQVQVSVAPSTGSAVTPTTPAPTAPPATAAPETATAAPVPVPVVTVPVVTAPPTAEPTAPPTTAAPA